METQKLKFKDMPFDFQRSIVINNGENNNVDWSVIPSFVEANRALWGDKDSVQIWIDDYAKVYGNTEFRIGEIDTEELKAKIMRSQCSSFESFDDYHEWYGDDTDHGDSVFPIVLSDCDECIEDGWHRFHSYIRKGLKVIPYVEYMYVIPDN